MLFSNGPIKLNVNKKKQYSHNRNFLFEVFQVSLFKRKISIIYLIDTWVMSYGTEKLGAEPNASVKSIFIGFI